MEKKIQQEKDKSKPVFYDPKGRRKKAFSWFLCISIVSISIVFYFFFQSIFSAPEIPNMNPSVKQDTKLVPINQKLSEEQLKKEEFKPNTEMKNDENSVNSTNDSKQSKEVYGFYVNWDENSTASLKENIDSLTTLVPEWYHLKADLTVSSEIKPDIVKLAKENHVKIMPLLTNYTEEASGPDSELIHKLLSSPDHVKTTFINDLVKQVEKNQFSGINIDFEAIPESDRENLTNFMKELTTVFHKHHLFVTQDVPANDKAFDYGALAKVIDRMIVMMYDEHYGAGVPGPIASNKWFEHTLNELDIPSEKLIVAFGNYGYDWEVNSKESAKSVTFSEVMKMAQDSNIKIQWDNISGNPYFRYKTGETEHTAWFLDGVTLYNQVKIAMNNNAKGFALWRLGAEDPTIWKVLKNPIEVQKNPDALHKIASLDEVNYSGQGEILQVENERHNGLRDFKVDKNGYFTDEMYQSLPSAYEVQRYGKPKGKQVALTFDDGPDPKYTPEILDILKEYKIKAAFFVLGENAQLNPSIVKRIYDEGHEIGNHTFKHPNVADTSLLRTKVELNTTQRLIQEITGHSTVLFRPPYEADANPDSSNEILPILRAQNMNYTMVAEEVDPEDWATPSTNELVKRTLNPIYKGEGNVILLHDAGGNRTHTVEALPMIIKDLKKNGYRFVTIADLMNKERDEVMPPVSSEDKQYLLYNKAVFSGAGYSKHILTTIFYIAIGLGIFRFLFLIYFSFKQKKKTKSRLFANSSYQPFVSVVIAAYNEEKVIAKTIRSILDSNYRDFEVIVVDDGSTDGTSKVMQETFYKHPKVRLIQKENGGKSSAMNLGFQQSRGEIIVTLDADTIIAQDAISLMIRHFEDHNVAAVSGNVKVGNSRNLLTTWQHVEYITGFNLERRAFDELNCITVVPGAIGAWRKKNVVESGYLSEDTLAEDTDLTITFLRQGHRIVYEEKAYAYTESPEDVKSLIKQRYRWSYGTLQCLWKHRKALFNAKHKTLGFIALPNMWLFQYVLQFIAPLADILMIMGLFGSNPLKVLGFYFVFFLMDLLASLFAFKLEKENPKPLVWLILQRFIYRQFMTYVVIKSIFSSIRGVAVGWNKLKRMGSVEHSPENKEAS
ncbi:glycosyl transferase family 2 [Bacillus cereus]|uniref:glycosyltransferase n=1 Tax=Bacillus nitratireducens TaxID=2026193 RepID=UPI000BEC3AB9|nr:glycosyltransferase [Bacillus nitratireducens]PEE14989.1 glycosyl transferase family 2 [Bacillus cereus]MED0903227.1 glycosyltransferase [Bacillus nitratireducens]PES79317.1 glycosyl transferase family 2 [Bacillus cereus]PFF32650.1 glycosyl transferase family 2 [Bacillus cereus]PFH84529.1 glycosyl transferase family 2 [Bacillus cereus]